MELSPRASMEEFEGLRESDVVAVVADVDWSDILLEQQGESSVLLFERRRLNGLSCCREAIELRRLIEVRRESVGGGASLDCDLRMGIVSPFTKRA